VFDDAGDHAGELETAAMLHVAPSLVSSPETWGDGAAKASFLEGVRRGWAWMPRRWTQVTADTGVGDPRAATAATGEVFMADAVANITALCVDLAHADPDALYR
jgi:creatinine amidohydrolase